VIIPYNRLINLEWTLLDVISSVPVRYESSYRPQKSNTRITSASEIEYQEVSFTRTTFFAESDGTVNETIHTEKYSIKVAKGWQQDIGDKPKNGYISKGLNKFVFKVYISPVLFITMLICVSGRAYTKENPMLFSNANLYE
jgi:hypothetical protein